MSNDKAGAVTDKGDKSQGNAPKLRFPEFVGKHLHDTRLGEVTRECKSRNRGKFAADVVMGVSKEDGIVPMQARLVADDIARYKIVRKDWFAYNPMRLNIGSIARWQDDNVVLVSPDYVVFCCTEIDEEPCLRADYLDHFRRSTHWSAFTGEAGDGGVRVRIYYDDIAKVHLSLPDGEEQQKIAAFLSSLDALIATETDKLAALRGHKKGLMQQLFPRPERVENGVKIPAETIPRLRFPEFRETEPWEAKMIGDVAPFQRGFDLASDEIRSGDIPVVYSNGIQKFHALGMAEGPGLVTGRSGTIGKIHYIDRGKYWPHNTSLWVTTFNLNVPKFVYYLYISIGLERFSSGSGVPTLNRNDVHAFLTCVPKTEEEQRLIAECFSSIDAAINAQSDKIEALKTHKSGLMQQLFPSPDEEAT